MTNAELIKALREVANWIVAMSYNSEYAHDELKMLHYEDSIRTAADALEADDIRIADYTAAIDALDDCNDAYVKENEQLRKRIAELEAQLPKEAHWVAVHNGVGVCSNCNRQDRIDNLATHCRYCGARMKGKQE